MEGKQSKPAKGFVYKQQFAVIVICADDREQKRVYERLLKQGLKLRVSSYEDRGPQPLQRLSNVSGGSGEEPV